MSAVEVTAALVHDASIAYRVEPVQYATASINLADLDAKMRAVLAAVIPDIERQVREKVAAEIEVRREAMWRGGCDNGAGEPLSKPWDHSVLVACDELDRAAAIARGQS